MGMIYHLPACVHCGASIVIRDGRWVHVVGGDAACDLTATPPGEVAS